MSPATIVRTVRVKRETVESPTCWKLRGSHPFPIDMLRRDCAWPASEQDSNVILSTIRLETHGPVEVEVYARRPLTIGRWRSFGWDVLGCR